MSTIEVCGCHQLNVCPNLWMGDPQILELTIESGEQCWVTPDGMAHYDLAAAQARLKELVYVPEPVFGGEG